jgi:hypothetical protein
MQMARPGPQRPAAGPEEVFPGHDYSDDEREFLVAMERYKRERRRPFPTCREVLAVLLSLGYRRVPLFPHPPAPSPMKGEGEEE